MSEIPVHIHFVLDRSGSMDSIKEDVIGGFNSFLAEQKKQSGRCRFSMIQFDTQNPAEVLYDGVDLARVEPLDANRFLPRSGTPLLDAEGWMIAHARQAEAERKRAGEDEEAILFVTFTDGMENSSLEWCYETLTAAKQKAEADGWAFMYLGCGHDGYEQASRIGSLAVRSYGRRGSRQAMTELSDTVTRYRGRSRSGIPTSSRQLFERDD